MQAWLAILFGGVVLTGACSEDSGSDTAGATGGMSSGGLTGGGAASAGGAGGAGGEGGAGGGVSNPLAPLWFVQVTGADDERVEHVRVGTNNRIHVSGWFRQNVEVAGSSLTSASDRDGFVAALDTDGELLWLEQLATTSGGFVATVLANGGGDDVVVAGRYAGDAFTIGTSTLALADGGFVARWDGLGALQSLVTIPCDGLQDLSAAAVGSTGAVVVGGRFNGTCTVNAAPVASQGEGSAFAMYFDATGTAQWMHAWGSIYNGDGLFGVGFEPGGEVVVGGFFAGQHDFGGGAVSATGVSDLVLLRYDDAGIYQSHRVLDWEHASSGLPPLRLETKSTGHPVIFGQFASLTIDTPFEPAADVHRLFLTELDTDLNTVFASAFASAGALSSAHGLGIGPDSRIAISGRSRGLDNDFPSPYVSPIVSPFTGVFSATGNAEFVANLGTSSFSNVFPHDTAVDGAGRNIVVGSFRGAEDFGAGEIDAQGSDADGFVLARPILAD